MYCGSVKVAASVLECITAKTTAIEFLKRTRSAEGGDRITASLGATQTRQSLVM